MTEKHAIEKGGQAIHAPMCLGKAYETVGAGDWTAPIWKRSRPDGEWDYRFSLWRLMEGQGGKQTRRFRPKDVLDLPKLAQVLAATLVADGCIELELKQDLQCLDSSLQCLLGEDGDADGRESLLPRELADAVAGVLAYLEDDERENFVADPSEGHVYRHVVGLRAWLDRQRDGDERPEEVDHFGGCPVCRRNDGYLNIGRGHWFVCHAHRFRWFVGANLFSSWKQERAEHWRRNFVLIGDYDVVDPVR